MATTDSNGIVRVEASDDVAPLHPVLNSLAQSVSNAFNAETRIYPVANAAARSAKVTEIGVGNISAARPLFVWRADAATGRNLEYTANGSTWLYYSSNADDTGWVNLVLKSGFTVQGGATPRVRRIGSIVYAQGRVAGTFTAGGSFANLPSGFTAPTWVTDISLTRTSVGNSPSALARGELTTSGDLRVFFGTSSTTAPTWVGLPPVLYVAA